MIVRVTEPMSFTFRGFARGVMRKRMVPVERYVIEQIAGSARIRNDKGVVFPLDGRPHVTGKDREVTSRLTETRRDRADVEGGRRQPRRHDLAARTRRSARRVAARRRLALRGAARVLDDLSARAVIRLA